MIENGITIILLGCFGIFCIFMTIALAIGLSTAIVKWAEERFKKE